MEPNVCDYGNCNDKPSHHVHYVNSKHPYEKPSETRPVCYMHADSMYHVLPEGWAVYVTMILSL